MPYRKLYLSTAIFCLFSFCQLSAVDRNDLVKTVEKISEAERLLSKEMTEWNSEKETLLLELSLIKASIKDFSGNQEKLLAKIEDLKKKKKQLESLVSDQEKLLKNINNFAVKNSDFLINVCDKFPQSLQFIISAPLNHLKAKMNAESIDIHEKVNAISALTAAILEAQKGVHRSKEVINLDNKLLEVDALYLGTFTAYFRAVDGTTGKILLRNGKWTADKDSSLKETIDALFDQFDKKGTPKMISLPIGAKAK